MSGEDIWIIIKYYMKNVHSEILLSYMLFSDLEITRKFHHPNRQISNIIQTGYRDSVQNQKTVSLIESSNQQFSDIEE